MNVAEQPKPPELIPPKILWQGSISESQLSIILVDQSESGRKIDPDIESKLKNIWNKKLAEALQNGITLYDGISYRLESFNFNNEILTIKLSPLQFSVRSTLKKMPELVELGEDYYSHGLSVGGFVETSDGQFAFIKKSDKSASSLKQDIIGGVLEETEPFTANRRELQEEVNVTSGEINEMKIIGLVRSSTTDIVITTYTKLNIIADELRKLFERKHDPEIDSMEFVSSSNLNDYLNRLGSYKPVMGKLLEPKV